jgi:hypothetical protein
MLKIFVTLFITVILLTENTLSQKKAFFFEVNSGMSFMNNTPLNAIRDMPLSYNELHQTVTQRPSMNLNLLFGYQLSKKLSLKTGLGYQNRVFDIGPVTRFFGSGGVPEKVSLRFITVPLNVQYAFYNDAKVQLYVSAGASMRFRTHKDENKQLDGYLYNEFVKKTEGLDAIRSRNTAMLYGYNSISELQPAVVDSLVHVHAVFYELNKMEWFTHVGTGLNVNLTERLAFTYGITYNFQLNKNSSFGKYSYTESYQNGTLFNKGDQLERSKQFRDNFFTMTAGFIFRF